MTELIGILGAVSVCSFCCGVLGAIVVTILFDKCDDKRENKEDK